MGRAKLEIKPIQKSTNRQITYSKRKKGLMKKAYELSTLGDIDLALLMFSPSDRLCLFSSQTRIEDVLAKYINLPDQEREKYYFIFWQYLLRILEQFKTENDMAFQINEPRFLSLLLTSQFSWFTKYINHYKLVFAKLQELDKELCRLQQQLQISEEELRKFEPDPVRFTSMEEMGACENHLLSTLTRVVQRREHLLSRSCEAPSTQKSMENIEGWEPEAEFKQARIYNSELSQCIKSVKVFLVQPNYLLYLTILNYIHIFKIYFFLVPSYDLPLQGIISNPTQTPK
ncbi:unnamed protein product [Brassica rapa]|uniref:MADS-box domain-containing protein n=1 Tax=Brassica campestris TaxID=3711 RepID=A0A8D9HS85_BRACM|nr:unnamed protein product [Brassica rapa]